MNLQDVQFFLRVSDLGSMTGAAKEENISISVASQRIQRLEKNLGFRLFHRTTRKLHLTHEGKIFIQQGRSLIKQLQVLRDNIKEQDHQLKGTIRIASSATFGAKILSPVIHQFLHLHPELKVYLDLNDQNIDLVENGIDLAVRIGHLVDSSLIAKPLSLNQRLLCASPNYIQHYGLPQNPMDLQQHRCILQQHQQGLVDHWDFIDDERHITTIKVQGHFTTNSGESIRQAALQGLGISNHSVWHVAEDLQSGRLVQVLNDYTLQPSTIYALTPERKLTPQRVHLFINYLQQYFSNQYPWYKELL